MTHSLQVDRVHVIQNRSPLTYMYLQLPTLHSPGLHVLTTTDHTHMNTSHTTSTMPPWPLQLSPVTASIVASCGFITSSCGLITNTSCRPHSQQCHQTGTQMELSQPINAVHGLLQHTSSLMHIHTCVCTHTLLHWCTEPQEKKVPIPCTHA